MKRLRVVTVMALLCAPQACALKAHSTLVSGTPAPQMTDPQPPGRFRLEADGEKKVGLWSWSRNPFVDTTPLRGLFVLMVMVNDWDLKTQQNPLYELTSRA